MKKFHSTKWGSYPVVIIADPQLVKKAFNHVDIQGRVDFHSNSLFNGLQTGGIKIMYFFYIYHSTISICHSLYDH